MVLFAFHIGIQQGKISLSSAPENIVGSAQGDGHVDRILNLHRGFGHHSEIRIRCRSVHIPWMGEEICCAPEQPDPGICLLLLCIVGNHLQPPFGFPYGSSFIRQIEIMKTIKRDACFRNELEGIIHPDLCPVEGI